MATALVAMVRDEVDIVEAWARWNAVQVDFMVVADNLSTDGTREILDGLAGELPLTVVDDREPGYRQSEKVSALAELARGMGAEWVVCADGDELWFSPRGRVADVLASTGRNVGLRTAEVFDFVATACDPDEVDPTRRIGWRRSSPLELPKVACRALPGLVVHQGNHNAEVPGGLRAKVGLRVRHYPYRSVEQFVGKVRRGAAAYRAAPDLPADMGAHWRQWDELSDDQLADVFRRFYWRAKPDGRLRLGGECQPPLVWDPL